MSQVISTKVSFQGALNEQLAARLDSPRDKKPLAYAIFAHCFTCSKDVFAANRISQALAARGIAVFRFDFTGLGKSDGDFANSNFSSNVGDLIAAAKYLEYNHQAPELLIGHSLGGAAVIAASPQLPSVKAITTIGAPADPKHVVHAFQANLTEINETGTASVQLGGRPFKIQKQFVDDLHDQDLKTKILPKLKKALMVMHAPLDATVDISNASDIFSAAKHPKSFVSLDGADHLLTKKADAIFVADVIASWAARYIDLEPETPEAESVEGVEVRETGVGKFQQQIRVGKHTFLADEPLSVGGLDTGPAPYDFLLAAVGSCTAMTMRIYADFKKLPLESVQVNLSHKKIHAKDCEDCETKAGKIDEIYRAISIKGDQLTDTDRAKLMEIADKCPVHRSLESENKIRTEMVRAS